MENTPTTLKELFKNWEDDKIRAIELDWGQPQGKELDWKK